MIRYRVLHLASDGRLDWQFITAPTVAEAASVAIQRGLTPLEIRAGNPSLLERLNQPITWGNRIGRADLTLLTDQLAALLEAGLPLDRSLDLLHSQAAARSGRTLLHTLLGRVRAGASLADACTDSRDIPRFYVGVLRAAERSGRLAGGLRDLATALRHAETTRQQAISALTYPAIVLLMTIAALAIVLVGVVPSFEALFAGEEDRLPLLTRVVLGLSRLVTQNGGWLLTGSVSLIGALVYAMRSREVQQRLRPYLMRLPGAPLYRTYTAGRVCRVLATMIFNGVPLQDAVVLAGGVTASRSMRRLLEEVAQRLREGADLSSTLHQGGVFPVTAIRLIEVGEQTGQLAGLCARAADLLEEAARVRLERLVGILNPLAILFLGGLIAALILGVMLGIFSVNEMAL